MDKPKSLSVKDFLIRKMSIKLNMPESHIDAVITHQFQSATKALAEKSSVELSGFGKFLFNEKKAAKRLDKMMFFKETYEKTLADENATERKKQLAALKLQKVIDTIDSIKPKLQDDESKSNI